jgi:hypothetical protein
MGLPDGFEWRIAERAAGAYRRRRIGINLGDVFVDGRVLATGIGAMVRNHDRTSP